MYCGLLSLQVTTPSYHVLPFIICLTHDSCQPRPFIMVVPRAWKTMGTGGRRGGRQRRGYIFVPPRQRQVHHHHPFLPQPRHPQGPASTVRGMPFRQSMFSQGLPTSPARSLPVSRNSDLVCTVPISRVTDGNLVFLKNGSMGAVILPCPGVPDSLRSAVYGSTGFNPHSSCFAHHDPSPYIRPGPCLVRNRISPLCNFFCLVLLVILPISRLGPAYEESKSCFFFQTWQ